MGLTCPPTSVGDNIISTSDSLEIHYETVPLATAHQIIMTETVPQHPYMAANGRSNIHNDAYMIDSGFSNLVNNHYAGLYLGSDGRAYVGVIEGIVSIAPRED